MPVAVLGIGDKVVKKTDDTVLVHRSSVRPRTEEIGPPFTSQGDLWCDRDMNSCVWEHPGWAPRLGVREGFLEEGTSDSGASQWVGVS